MKEYLNAAFGAGGHLSKVLGGYKPRQGQIDYAVAVDAAFESGRPLLAEGATGVGKSFGYGVPAAHYARRGKRVLIATSNIALQEQLAEKDLPLLAEALPWPVTFKLAKGRSNYLCRAKLAEFEPAQGNLFRHADAGVGREIAAWAALTATGDGSELPFEPPYRVWRDFSSTSDECNGYQCPLAADCFAMRARAELEDAGIIVANYHLLFSHLVVREKVGMSPILPDFDAVVLDEGHKAADIARGFLGFRVTAAAVSRIARKAGGGDQANLEAASGVFFSALASYARSSRYKVRIKRTPPLPWDDFASKLQSTSGMLDEMAEGAEGVERYMIRRHARRALEIASDVCEAMEERDERVAYYVEERSGAFALCSKPADPGDWLNAALFSQTPAVVTSATLEVGRKFDYMAGELGLEEGSYDGIVVPSPFRWSERALLVLPKMPDPKAVDFADRVAEEVCEIVGEAQGRTLALFTSYRGLNRANEMLARSHLPYRLLRQGDKPRTMLAEQFRTDVSSVLLGTESFWGGVDVPGESLVCVVIDKLPFPPPDDPVLDLICSQDKRWFFNVSLPRAVLTLKQGVGRLLRSVDDYGVVVILDPRLTTKGYGKVVMRSLPVMAKTRDVGVVGQFLDDMASEGAA
jgi:ATP-dependent DNA helicase DinG